MADKSQEAEVLWRVEGAAGLIVLNRPLALNALTLNMVRLIGQALDAFERDARVTRVVVLGAGPKAFCAGGDIRALYEEGKAGNHANQLMFWQEEYLLNIRIKHYPKPFISLIDGIVMGGGVGISQHGTLRVISEKYLFAMPEVAIGFFPDVGASYFLPRLPGNIGMFLAVTGTRVKAGDAIAFGLADYFVRSARFNDLAQALVSGDVAEATIATFAEAVPAGEIAQGWTQIEALFAPGSAAEIVARLETANRGGHVHAGEILAELRKKSPFSVALTAVQMQRGAELAAKSEDIAAAMRIEYRLVSRIVDEPDFYEGVRALIIDRDQNPRWRHARIEDVPVAEVEAMFAPLPGAELPGAELVEG